MRVVGLDCATDDERVGVALGGAGLNGLAFTRGRFTIVLAAVGATLG